jgi:hypothetical protein
VKTLRITEIRQDAKDNEWPDSWLYSIDGTESEAPVKIGKVPREKTVLVRNEIASEDDWIRFRYPGYMTPEEIEEKKENERKREEAERLRMIPSEKQKVSLDFFGKNSESVTKEEASELLGGLFDRDYSRHDYREFQWKHRHRLYDSEELLLQNIYRHQNSTFMLTERISHARIKEAVVRAVEESIPEDQFLDFLRKHYSNFFLSEDSRKKKRRDLNESVESEREFRKSESKQGCLSLILFASVGIITLITLTQWV